MKKNSHNPCPSCPSSDAYFVYSDGHGHCYSCGYHDPGTNSIESMRMKLAPTNLSSKDIDISKYTHSIPPAARVWLRKYGITDAEISKYQIMWNPDKYSLVFPIFSGGRVVVTNERYYGHEKKHPKYLTRGNKTAHFNFFGKESDEIILVEDYVSAIKIARQARSCPLLGSTVPMPLVLRLVDDGYKSVKIWLDRNKAKESIEECNKLSQFITEVKPIITELDPKEYNDEAICETISI